ncbi:CAP domain-containing protein [Candidatus Saccharibacteria bacterium]|nr:CAP domain-containing protein [Candidatus Saccharibacteria bacterium]
MAKTAGSSKKRTAVSKSKKSTNTNLPFAGLRNSRLALFVLAFAAVGVFALFQIGAKPDLPTYSDDIVVGYIDLKPTNISQDENGNTAYEMYPAVTYVQADGTLVCDPGSSNTTTVTTGMLSKKEVEKLHQDIVATEVTSLADEITVGNKDALIQFEGFVVGGAESAKGTAVYAGAQKPAKFAKAQEKLQAVCAKATKSENRSNIKQPREPKINGTKKSLVTQADELLTPKASACCSVGQDDTAYGSDQHNRINNHRKASGKSILAVGNTCMIGKAYEWTRKMVAAGRISHDPNLGGAGTQCYGSRWNKLGENVGVGYDSAGLMQAFINSPGHNANLLDSAWEYLGVGAVRGSNGRTFVTHRFVSVY